MVILKEENNVSLSRLSKFLSFMKIEKLNIFCINGELDNETINYVDINNNSYVKYVEMNLKNFLIFLNSDQDFWEYNKDTLYIIKDGSFLDIKNIFCTINNNRFNLGRGGSQKAHGLSPLDLRLSSYLMAMLDLDYKKISRLNFFDEMDKTRYLSYKDVSIKNSTLKNQ